MASKKKLLQLKPEQHLVTAVPKITTDLPFFSLTLRRKDVPKVIEYHDADSKGRPINWQVFPNTSKKIGAPGVEAHRVWTLLIKPTIDAHRKPDGSIPEIIPLGRLRECLRKVGWSVGGRQARGLIHALVQISFAGCVADFWLPTGQFDESGKEHSLHVAAIFSRLSIYAIGEYHVTEEQLATANLNFGFDLEDTVYIRLDPVEVKLLENQAQRFIDNQYMFSVKPAARRWYELVAPKIFGVVKNNGEYCEIRYSWYIKHHHTLKRYHDSYRVIFQMNRLLKEHLSLGYLTKIEYCAIKEAGKEVDYLIRYYPGETAKASIARILTYIRQQKKMKDAFPVIATTVSVIETDNKSKEDIKTKEPIVSSELSSKKDKLIAELTKRGVDRRWASNYIGNASAESLLKIEDLIEYFDYIVKIERKKVKSPGGFLRTMLEEQWTLPPNFQSSRQQKGQGQAHEPTEGKLESEKSYAEDVMQEIQREQELDRLRELAFNSLTPDEQVRRVQAMLDEMMKSEHRKIFKRMPDDKRKEHAIYLVQKELVPNSR